MRTKYFPWVPQRLQEDCSAIFPKILDINKIQETLTQAAPIALALSKYRLLTCLFFAADPNMEKVWASLLKRISVDEEIDFLYDFQDVVVRALKGPSSLEKEDQQQRDRNLRKFAAYARKMSAIYERTEILQFYSGLREPIYEDNSSIEPSAFKLISTDDILEGLAEECDDLIGMKGYLAHVRGKSDLPANYFLRILQQYFLEKFDQPLDETVEILVRIFFGREIDRTFVKNKRIGFQAPTKLHREYMDKYFSERELRLQFSNLEEKNDR